ncbi:hypothetical protein Dimus_033776 [Dionaea muscipula]
MESGRMEVIRRSEEDSDPSEETTGRKRSMVRGSEEDSDPSGEMIRTKRIHSAAASVERDDVVEGVSGFVFVLTDLELKIFHVKDVADYDGKEGLCIDDLSSPVRIADAVNSVDFLWGVTTGTLPRCLVSN